MRNSLLTSVALLSSVSAGFLHTLPEDIYAFPKYRVEFLNGLSVLNVTVERWLKQGLRGGEREFMDQPWQDRDGNFPSSLKEIDSGEPSTASTSSPEYPSAAVADNFTLEYMKMGPHDSYICLIPKPLNQDPLLKVEDSHDDVTPEGPWSLLQSLTGTCLYHRQGWFTYSYCHNDEIRQFREIIPAQIRYTGTYQPEEDPEQEAYTLGLAPEYYETGADLAVAEENTRAANLELAQSAGSRYLVQRWGDGTICDMTGKNREVEVQFHCSMEMTDRILLVKETKTCSYVLVIHTPRLCNEPGFKSRRDAEEQARIRCREIVDKKPEDQMKLSTADHPTKVPVRKTVLPAPKPAMKVEKAADGSESKQGRLLDDLLLKTLEALVAGKKSGDKVSSMDDDLIIEFVGGTEDGLQLQNGRIIETLRAAGYNVGAGAGAVMADGSNEKDGDKQKKPAENSPIDDPHHDHDEL